MSWYAITCIVLGSWTVVGFVVAVPVGRAIRRADEACERGRQYPPPVAERITVIRELPEVPPTRTELAWLADQPAESLRGTALRWKFEQVVREGIR